MRLNALLRRAGLIIQYSLIIWPGTTPTSTHAQVPDRYRLRAGDELSGSAVVEEEGSTLVVGLGGRARVAASGNIVVTLTKPAGSEA